ncbi:MAG: hypothetical protein ACR2M0_12720 [Chloroflexia bacterium]
MDLFAANQTPVAGDTVIIEDYPQPPARAWQRVLISSPRPSFHHLQLLVAAEWLVFYLGAVAISVYEQVRAEGGASDPTLNRSLRNLRRPTYGQWLGWVRGALNAVPAGAALLPGLRAAYETPDDGMLLLGYEGLRGIMAVQLGYTGDYGPREEASPRLLLELINQYQLRRANHPLPPGSGFDEMAVVTALAPGLRAAYNRFGLLAAYPLLGLVRTPAGGIEVLKLQGLDLRESAVELDPAADPPGTLLLADPNELPMLVLDPWLIYAECPECGQVQVAAFSGQDGDVQRYLGLECEHTWTRGPDLVLAEVELGGAGEGWSPDLAGMPADVPTDAQERLFAAFEAEAEALTAERRALRIEGEAFSHSDIEGGGFSHSDDRAETTPQQVYLDLLEQRAAGGLTLDQLQHLDEEQVAEADNRRRAEADEV